MSLTKEELTIIKKRAEFVTGMQYDGRIPDGAYKGNLNRITEQAEINKSKGKSFDHGWI